MRYILSLYAWISGLSSFFVVALLGILATFIFPVKISDIFIRNSMRFIIRLMLIKVETEGYEKIDKTKGCLYLSNHISFLDAPLASGYFPTAVRGIEAASHFKWPIYGWLATRYGNLPIDRSSVSASIKSFRNAAQIIKNGRQIIVFPEGHRTRDGKLQQFKKLPFRIAQEEGLDIVPVSISGMYGLNSYGSFFVNIPTTIKIKIGDIIPATTVQSMTTEQLVEAVHKQVAQLIERP